MLILLKVLSIKVVLLVKNMFVLLSIQSAFNVSKSFLNPRKELVAKKQNNIQRRLKQFWKNYSF
jgi:hypothetical protein